MFQTFNTKVYRTWGTIKATYRMRHRRTTGVRKKYFMESVAQGTGYLRSHDIFRAFVKKFLHFFLHFFTSHDFRAEDCAKVASYKPLNRYMAG